MRSKTIVNGKGEPQETRIEIPLKGGGGVLGMQAVTKLTALISGLKNAKTEYDVLQHFYTIQGYAMCCRDSGFLEHESTNDILKMAEHLADNEINRIRAEGKAGNDSP